MLNKLTFANLGHRPVRTLLSILAVAVEVTMIFTLVGVSNDTLHESARGAKGTGADVLWSLSPVLLLHPISFGLELSCTALLVYSPFAQRSLILMGAGGEDQEVSAILPK